jgi:sulfite reductase alpha subunit
MAEKINKRETPLLDELDKGPWPSFIKEFKTLQDKKEVINDLLGQLEYSYETKILMRPRSAIGSMTGSLA